MTGVAIVDNETDRRLIGNISTKDLKGIDADGKWLSRLFLPAEAYLQEMRSTFPVCNNIYYIQSNKMKQSIKLIYHLFLSHSPPSILLQDLPRPESPIYSLPNDTLENVLRKVIEHKVHRVFIVNNDTERKPIGVITMKDILREVIV